MSSSPCEHPLRDPVAHGHFDVNLDTAWEKVQSALPTLERALSKI